MPALEIEAVLSETGTDLADIRLFDLYQGKGIAEGFRSLAYSLAFQSHDRTLTDEEVDASVDRILKELKKRLRVKLR